jgi:hypothetical protein
MNNSWKDRALELYKSQQVKSIKSIRDTINQEYNTEYTKDKVKKVIYRRLKKENTIPTNEVSNINKHRVEIYKDGTQVSEKLLEINSEQLKDVNYMLEIHGYDKEKWELISAKNNIWNVYSKSDGIQTLYSSKIAVKARITTLNHEEIVKHMEELLSKYERPTLNERYIDSNIMLELPIMDLHLSKFGWSLETGESYNSKIAEERFLYIISEIKKRIKQYEIEKIIFPIGQDFFHFDTPNVTTTNGTRQDADSRWNQMFLHGCELIIKAIDILQEISNVDIFYIAGNHDKTTSYYLTMYIYAWFRNNNRVTVNISPTARKYYEYGNNLIGYTHSNMERERIYKLMQVEAREAWGRTLYHEWHVGHLHKEKTTREFYKIIDDEECGIIVRHIPSITGSDAWHTESGYIGTVKKAQAFIWHKEYGLLEILNIPIIF